MTAHREGSIDFSQPYGRDPLRRVKERLILKSISDAQALDEARTMLLAQAVLFTADNTDTSAMVQHMQDRLESFLSALWPQRKRAIDTAFKSLIEEWEYYTRIKHGSPEYEELLRKARNSKKDI